MSVGYDLHNATGLIKFGYVCTGGDSTVLNGETQMCGLVGRDMWTKGGLQKKGPFS